MPALTTLHWLTHWARIRFSKEPHGIAPMENINNQIDYIMMKTRFRSSINTAKTRSFPGADIGSDHDLVMMTCRIHIKRVFKKQGYTRIKFDLDKLKDPKVAEAFQAMIGGKFAALNIIDADHQNMDTIKDIFDTAVTDSAFKILGKVRPTKKPWVTANILDECDQRRALKKTRMVVQMGPINIEQQTEP